MIATQPSVDTVRRTVRRAAVLALAAAIAALAVGTIVGQLGIGLALAIGLALGSMNGMLVRQSVNVGLAFTGLSMARLLAFTFAALLISAILGWRQGPAIVVGLAIAQLILVGVAARDLLLK